PSRTTLFPLSLHDALPIWVDIKSGDRTIKAFVVYPERKEKAPAALVVQEIFGLTDWLRSMCDELAENGVIAIAPDFLNGQKFEEDRKSTRLNSSHVSISYA